MECVEEFSAIQIDLEEDMVEPVNAGQFQNTIIDQKIIELKMNHIPKGMVPLEILFDNNDVYVNLLTNLLMITQPTVIFEHKRSIRW